MLYVHSLPYGVIKGNRRWHFPSENVNSVGAVGWSSLPSLPATTAFLPWHHSLAAVPGLGCETLCSCPHVLQSCWHNRCITLQLVPAASVEKDTLDVLALSNKSNASLWSGRLVTWFLSSLVKQTKLFPPSKVNPGAVQEMLLPEVKSFLSQDCARFGFFCPTQSSTSSQRAVYFETHHMFWCHILRSLSSMLCTHRSVLTDCMTAFLLFQVFKLKHLKAQTIISKRQKDGMSKWDLTAGHPTSSPTKKFFHCVAWGTGMFSRIDVVLSLTGRCN